MYESAESLDLLKDITIDPEFESVCPPLTEDEIVLLEQNILADGEVTSPLIVWDNNLIDGHHRRQIILNHPELPFKIKGINFADKYEAIAWICRNQAGRRNLRPEQLAYLIGKRYDAEKHTIGSTDGFRGNQHTDVVRGKNYPIPRSHATAIKIADENGIGEKTVRLYGEYAKGVDAAEVACPGVKQELLSGSFKPTKKEVGALSKLPAAEVADKISEYRKNQAEREEKKQKKREKKCTQADEGIDEERVFTSIGELCSVRFRPSWLSQIRCTDFRDLQQKLRPQKTGHEVLNDRKEPECVKL